MARRRVTGDTIELEYNGREILFREDMDEWTCSALKLKAKSLTALKRKIDNLDGEARRVSMPVIHLGSGYSDPKPANIVMLAKAKEWESLRYNEQPDNLAGLHNRRVPSVWIMVPNGNHPAERKKVRLDECARPDESTRLSIKEADKLEAEAKRLNEQAEAIMKAIPRVTLEELTGKVNEDDLDEA
jgi:hypothetical protein